MKVKQFTVNHFAMNCFVLWDEATKQCAIVDPGAETSYEEAQITQYIEENGLEPAMILLTHAHVDHIAGLKEMCERYKLPVTMHADGKVLLRQAEAYGAVMGFEVERMDRLPVNEISGGDVLMLGQEKIECREVPGHCPGSMAYVLPGAQMVLTGDALFRGSIGRTDLPGGNYQLLIDKIRTQLLTLPDDYEVLPGHGDISTIGEEQRYNGFLI
jgi:glyoxylase-like metal-dependent hydrolase (beta-lactamase superfamily II)